MEGHSEALRFEQAAAARDKLRAVERTMEQQKMAAFSRAEHDVVGMAREEDEACIQVMQVRSGKLIGREHFIVEGARDAGADVVLGSENYEEDVRFNGEAATFMGVWVLPNANSLDVIASSSFRIDAMRLGGSSECNLRQFSSNSPL